MSSPVVFLSAATLDLKPWRDTLHGAFSRAGFRVLTQDHSLRAASGDVRRLLAETIAEADCVIHLAGMAYGSHATDPFPADPAFQCSWTQFEYYHAHATATDVIAFVCAPSLSEPFVESADRAQLQQAHRRRVESGDFGGTPLAHLPRTANESISSQHNLLQAVAAAIGTLGRTDPAYDRVQSELQALLASLYRIEHGQETHRRFSRRALAITLAALALLGGGIWLVRRGQGNTDLRLADTTRQLSRLDEKIDSRFTSERRFMALILARANSRIKDWETMTPAQRFDLALGEIAAEQKIPSTELRSLLDLYVTLVQAEANPAAEDLYYVQMRQSAFAEAAQTASHEATAAVSRMHSAEARARAADLISQAELQTARAERERAIDFHTKEGLAYDTSGSYPQALLAFEKALALCDPTAQPLVWATAAHRVGVSLLDLVRYPAAEPLLRETLALREAHLPPADPAISQALNSLALLCKETNRLDEAERLIERALRLDESTFGTDHPAVASDINHLAQLYQETNRHRQAEPLFERALRIHEAALGEDHPTVANNLITLALLYQQTNRHRQAEPLIDRALRIDEDHFGKDHPIVAGRLVILAQLYQETNRRQQAEPLLLRALRIDEATFGKDHPTVAMRLSSLGALYFHTQRYAEAEELMLRSLRIGEEIHGKDHPRVSVRINNLAQLYKATHRLTEAEPLMQRALRIDEASYGADHPLVATRLGNLAQLYLETGRQTQAEPLMLRALHITETSFGKDHPDVANALNNLASLYQATHRAPEAEAHCRRHVLIYLRFTRANGHDHPNLQGALANYRGLLTLLPLTPAQLAAKLDTLGPEAGWSEADWKPTAAALFKADYKPLLPQSR